MFHEAIGKILVACIYVPWYIEGNLLFFSSSLASSKTKNI